MIIPFEEESRKKYYDLLDEVFDSSFLSHGKMNQVFEEKFSQSTGLKSCTIANGGCGLLALLKYIDVKDKDVIVPTNTFMATPLSVKLAGGNVVFADCKKEDLCVGLEQIKKVITKNTKAIIVVHIGGHLAFDIFEISEFCKSNGVSLIEDCAHAHGATFKGVSAGSFGVGGSYSFYATKTMPMGEGGMVVSSDTKVIDFVNKYKNYGKLEYEPGRFKYPIEGFNFRMSEIMAAFGIVQMERLPKILEWKRKLALKYDQIFDKTQRVVFPEGMESGFYKYIVFNVDLKLKTGSVFDELCHNIMETRESFENSEWVAKNHSCPPMFYGWEMANKSVDELKQILLDK